MIGTRCALPKIFEIEWNDADDDDDGGGSGDCMLRVI